MRRPCVSTDVHAFPSPPKTVSLLDNNEANKPLAHYLFIGFLGCERMRAGGWGWDGGFFSFSAFHLFWVLRLKRTVEMLSVCRVRTESEVEKLSSYSE